MTRWPSRNRARLDELSALTRPLTEAEQAEVMHLKRRLSNIGAQRRRYARDPEFRERVKRQNLNRYHEARA